MGSLCGKVVKASRDVTVWAGVGEVYQLWEERVKEKVPKAVRTKHDMGRHGGCRYFQHTYYIPMVGEVHIHWPIVIC